MAELAFEAVARLAMVVIIFSLLVSFIYMLYDSSTSSLPSQGLVEVDMSALPPQALSDIVDKCRSFRGVKEKRCAILVNLDQEDRSYLEELGVLVTHSGPTALLVYKDGQVILK